MDIYQEKAKEAAVLLLDGALKDTGLSRDYGRPYIFGLLQMALVTGALSPEENAKYERLRDIKFPLIAK